MEENIDREERLRKKIAKLLRFFESYQVIVDDSPVPNVKIHPIKGTRDNLVVTLSWREMGMDFTCQITEEGLANAEIGSDNVWEIEDHEGEVCFIEFTAIRTSWELVVRPEARILTCLKNGWFGQ